MKKLRLLFAFCTALLLLSMSACSDDDSVQEWPGGTTAKLLPVKIYGKDNGGMRAFEYDDSNRLTTLSYYFKSDGNLSKYSELKIEYDSQGRIVKTTDQSVPSSSSYAYTEVNTFTYDGSQVVMNGTYFTSEIKIDAQGRILERKDYDKGNEELVSASSYSYDQKGNIGTEEYKNNRRLVYTYDNQNGIFSHINAPQWFLVSVLGMKTGFYNNITETKTYAFGIEEYVDPTTSKTTYTYNANGYPIKYVVPVVSFCGTPPLPETTFEVEYKEAKIYYPVPTL